MHEKDIEITNKNGIHTRPAAILVKEAQTFESKIDITAHGKTANAKSIFSIQTLDLSKGTTLTISASGEDEEKAVEQLVSVISKFDS